MGIRKCYNFNRSKDRVKEIGHIVITLKTQNKMVKLMMIFSYCTFHCFSCCTPKVEIVIDLVNLGHFYFSFTTNNAINQTVNLHINQFRKVIHLTFVKFLHKLIQRRIKVIAL